MSLHKKFDLDDIEDFDDYLFGDYDEPTDSEETPSAVVSKPFDYKRGSSFWSNDRYNFNFGSYQSETVSKNKNTAKLAEVQNAVSNFVRIISGRKIPVRFLTTNDIENGQTARTDGNTIYLTPVDDEYLDVQIGMAIHEAAHILHTNFQPINPEMIDYYLDNDKDVSTFYGKLKTKGQREKGREDLGNFINLVEDIRVDNLVYKDAIGYRQYGHAFANFVLNEERFGPVIDDIRDRYENDPRSISIDDYLAAIALSNVSFGDKNLLPGVSELSELVSAEDVTSNVLSTDMSAERGQSILNKIVKLIEEIHEQELEPQDSDDEPDSDEGDESPQDQGQPDGRDADGDSDSGDGNGSKSSGNGNGKDSGEKQQGFDGEHDPNAEDTENNPDAENTADNGGDQDGQDSDQQKPVGNDGTGTSNEEVKRAIQTLKNSLGNQASLQDIQEGSTKSEMDKMARQIANGAGNRDHVITPETAMDIETLSSMERDQVNVEYGNNKAEIDTLFLTPRSLQSNYIREKYGFSDPSTNYRGYRYDEEVASGIRKAKYLAKHLQLRNEDRATLINRQKKGRIDKRRVWAAGAGGTDIFNSMIVEKFPDYNIHVSIDQSGSMGGQRWRQSIEMAAMLGTALAKIKGVNLQVSIRTTSNYMGDHDEHSGPFLATIYDSKKSSLTDLYTMLTFCNPNGGTPESLCFPSVMKQIESTRAHGEKCLFINLCDGSPGASFLANGSEWQSYGGYDAYNHIKHELRRMKGRGINSCTFFMDYMPGHDAQQAYGKTMYIDSATTVKSVATYIESQLMEGGWS